MGYQLWLSPHTGNRRRGTTLKELQYIFRDRITTQQLYEPIYSCRVGDNSETVLNEMKSFDFDVVGVLEDKPNGKVISIVQQGDLQGDHPVEAIHPITSEFLISDSTPVIELWKVLETSDFALVLRHDRVDGIVTKWDINKPIVRIYLFGIISLFELHFNFLINQYYPHNGWQAELNADRLRKAKEIHSDRQGNNDGLTLLECIQIGDKKSLLCKVNKFFDEFGFSKTRFKKLMERAESIRNELAHSQNSIIDNLDFKDFVQTISEIEQTINLAEIRHEKFALDNLDLKAIIA